jgi:hypothetical protein
VAAEEEEERSDDAQGVRERRTHPGRADPPMHGAGRSRSRERRVRSSSVRAPVSGEFARENDPSQSPSPLDEDMTEAASRGGPAQLPDPVGSEPAMAQAPVSYDYPRAPEDEPAGARAPQPPAPPLFQNPTGPGFGYGPGFGVSQFPGYFAPFAGQGNYPPRPLFQNPTGPGFGYGPGPGVTLPPGYFAPIVGQCQPPAQALFQDPRRPGFVIGTGYGFPQLTVFPPTVRRPRAASSSISGTSPS